MFDFLKNNLRRYPRIIKRYRALQWRKHIWSDWFNTYINKNRIQYDTPFGFKMVARNYIANRLMKDGNFENEEIELITSKLKGVDIFVDVGANIGFYTCLACSLEKYVIAIEPQTLNLKCLYENLTINQCQNVEVFPIGLSN